MTTSSTPAEPQASLTTTVSLGSVAPGSVVVGIDGSPSSDLALDWATETASGEQRQLTLVHSSALDAGVRGSLFLSDLAVDVGALATAMTSAARHELDIASARVRRAAPGLTVNAVLDRRDPRESLLELGREAHCLVVGSRGRGGFASLLLGSVSVSVATHAVCPVVVVRHPTEPTHGGILLDVDGTEDSLAAVEFAYRTASFRGWPLTALSVVWDAAQRDHGTTIPETDNSFDDVRTVVSESLAGMREKYPDVDDGVRLVHGFRDRELLRATQGRNLVVVASHPGGLAADLFRGAVASTVVERAACNVAVVPAAA